MDKEDIISTIVVDAITDVNLNNSKQEIEISETAVYNKRWLMLAVVFLLNISNGALWITFATISGSTAEYYGVEPDQVNWLSLVFYITTIPMMFIALWVTDKFGFKPSALTGSAFNGIGSLIRLLSTIPGIPHEYRYPIAMTGQTITSLAQPFIMALPTKVSEVWFPENQRTLSTTVAAMANPLGFMVASIISPVTVSKGSDVPIANNIICGIGIAVGLFGFVVRQSNPPKPPSIAAAKSDKNSEIKAQSYITDLKQILQNKNFMVLTLAIGGGMGLVSGLQTLMAQIICTWGYDDNVTGLCCAIMVLLGFVGAGVYSFVAEKTKLMEELIKIGFTFAVVLAIVFILVSRIRDISWALVVVSGLLGFLAMGVYPICLETGVEITYPLDESFSSGMIVVSGQIQGAIFIPVMEAIARPLSPIDKHYEVCTSGSENEVYDMTYSGIFLVAYAAVLNVILIAFFKPEYKRLEAEKTNIIIAPEQSPSSSTKDIEKIS